MTMSPQFLEAMNGFLLVDLLAIVWLFFRYIAQGFYEYGWHSGRRQRAAAIGVFTLILGDFIIRLSVWTWRHVINTSGSIDRDLEAILNFGTTFGVAVAAIGGACIIRYFSPARWGEWPWILVTAVAASWSSYMVWG